MKIIDNKKDYYDYLGGIYGIDNHVVYDRRGSNVLENQTLDEYFSKSKMFRDAPKMPPSKRKGRSWRSLVYGDEVFLGNENELRGEIMHGILEVGTTHYVFEIERSLNEKDEVVLEGRLIEVKKGQPKISEAPMSFFETIACYSWRSKKVDVKIPTLRNKHYDNPILKGTYLSQIAPNEIWDELYNYILSTKEKPIVDSRTNIQKLESLGFDKKSSFRHPVK